MPTIYQFDDVRVDLKNFQVFKAGRAVRLEPKAVKALLFLIEHRGRLIEKRELLDAVWEDTFVTENAMTKVIAKLRKTLGDGIKEAKYIETVPTRGYRFVAEVEGEGRPGGGKATNSLAVLPFINVSADPDLEYLGDVIAESIINSLSRLRQLRVMARSATFRYKGLEIDPREVGLRLGVRAVLTGESVCWATA